MGFDRDRVDAWLAALEARQLADLTFPEVARALRALSSAYVERRSRLREGAALSGAGKRAAFALFYGPLHFLLVREIVGRLPVAAARPHTLVDLGCGTGASAAGFVAGGAHAPEIAAVDRHPWALAEAAWTFRQLGLRARTTRGDLTAIPRTRGAAAILLAFAVNELDDDARERLLPRLLARAEEGDRVLVVEPLARSVVPWWDAWSARIVAAGGRADEWRFRVERPPIVEKLDRAAGLDHRELTGRSLFL